MSSCAYITNDEVRDWFDQNLNKEIEILEVGEWYDGNDWIAMPANLNTTAKVVELYVPTNPFHPWEVYFLQSGFKIHMRLPCMSRNYKPIKSDRFPNECPHCGGPAYIGAVPAAVDCQKRCR